MHRLKPLPWKHKPFPELVRLAWPISVSMLSYSVMTLVSTLFVGRLGATALAAVGLGGVYVFTLLCFGFGLLRAVKVQVSQAVGAEQTDRIAPIVGAGLALAAALGIASLVAGWVLAPSLDFVAESQGVAHEAQRFARVRLLGAPFFLLACAMREAQNGMGDARTAMRAAIAANIVNIALDALFILQLGFGVPGAAAAAVLANGVEVLWLARAQRRIGFGLSALRRQTVARLWRLGVPIGLQFLLEVGAFATLTAIFASMGELDLAAHQIALQLCHFSFMPMVALGEAASILVGQAIGARASGLVRRVARMAVYVTLAYGVLCGLVFAILGEVLASAFTKEAPLVALAAKLLYVAAAFQIFDGANIVARSVLRGTGDVRFAALIGVICAWVCTPPLAIGLGYGAGLGALGGWLGLCIEIVAGTAILWWRLERGYWVVSARSLRRAEAALHPA